VGLLGCGTEGAGQAPSVDVVTEEPRGEAREALVAAAGQSIAAGPWNSCVILSGGAVKCWGQNDGILGIGDIAARGDGPSEMGDRLPMVNLGAAKVTKQLAIGTAHVCALFTTGQVKCWGQNADGELGQGDVVTRGAAAAEMGENLPLVDLGTGRIAKAIAAGGRHTCALLDTNQVKCWGFNGSGQLGQGDLRNRGDNPGELGDNLGTVQLGVGRTATAIAAGDDVSCALLDDATVKCWGDNASGALGQGDTLNRGDDPNEMVSLTPISLGAGLVVKAISTNGGTSCALFTTGQMKCWGRNNAGQLGLGDTVSRGVAAGQMGDALPLINLGTRPTVKAIASGIAHTCALLDLNETIAGQVTTNQVKCWGSNSSGELGQQDAVNRGDGPNEMGNNLPLVAIGTGRSVRALSSSPHNCVVNDLDQVKCWGLNLFGQLGYGDNLARGDGPNEMGAQLPRVDLGNRGSLGIAVGAAHTCVRIASGEVKCWGDGTSGARGSGTTDAWGDGAREMGISLPSVPLGTARTALAVAAANHHTCAVLNNSDVKCWGANDSGQLGLGDVASRGDQAGEMGDALPRVELGTGKLAKAVAPGNAHSCALLTTNEVKCWGSNSVGQLGQGNTLNRGDNAGEMGDSLPAINLGTGRTAKMLAVGGAHSCVILNTNQVGCWGQNTRAQLGIGSALPRGDGPNEMGDNLALVDLGTGRTAKFIASGATHNCAILDNNQVKCWGQSFRGGLGLGSVQTVGDLPGQMGDALPAIALGTGRTAKALALGSDVTCVLLDTNQLKCFGDNFQGQLGLGDTKDRGLLLSDMGDALPTVFLGTGRTVSAVVTSAFSNHVCALLDSGQAKCWGENALGQLGQSRFDRRGDNPNELGDFLLPIDIGPEPL
jgi:alpha-tubulin suppressor-like RCC1 family protein